MSSRHLLSSEMPTYRKPSKDERFERAIDAIDARDADALCWELLRASLAQLDARGKAVLADGMLTELVRSVARSSRTADAAPKGAPEASSLRDWLEVVEGQGGKKRL